MIVSKGWNAHKKSDYIRLVQTRIAEFQSRHPDTTLTFDFPHFTTPLECLGLLGAILYFTKERIWESEKAIRYVAGACYKNQYQGKWEQVQEVLENVTDFSDYSSYLLANLLNEEDYYGNLEPLIFRIGLLLEPKAEGEQYGKVRKPVRRRGYRDKGTLRPDWQKRTVALLKDERDDRRNKVKHPLIFEEKVKNHEEFEVSKLTEAKKGDEENDIYEFIANSNFRKISGNSRGSI